MTSPASLPPAIILGGGTNALSIARSLAKHGVPVYAINDASEPVRYSRYCRWIPIRTRGFPELAWEQYLVGAASDALRGSVLLSACDAGIEILLRNREALAQKFRLDISNPVAQRAMLDKLATYRVARKAGVRTPLFWATESPKDLFGVRSELVYPLLVKPLSSHAFQRVFEGRRYLEAQTFDEAVDAFREVQKHGIRTMLVEKIPGPDSLLCSYYTYIDETGSPVFDFTKRVLRRYPVCFGPACAHVTDKNPLVAREASKLFREAGLIGVANAELKRDPRDGELKLIECNARFTAANALVTAAGIDLASLVYFRAIGRDLPMPTEYRRGLSMWYPATDLQAFGALSIKGELGGWEWLTSVAKPHILPYFAWNDPAPSLAHTLDELHRMAARRILRLKGAPREPERPVPYSNQQEDRRLSTEQQAALS